MRGDAEVRMEHELGRSALLSSAPSTERRPKAIIVVKTNADCSRLVGAYEGTRARDLNQETVWQGHPVLRPLQGEE